MSYKAIIFDMDGVIIDSKEHVEQFWRDKLEKYDIEPDGTPEELALRYHGRPARLIIDDLFEKLPESERQALAEECAAYDASAENYDYIPGVREVLKACLDLGLTTGLVTSALPSKVDLMLDGLGFDSPFDTTVTADRVRNGKPDPECYRLAAQELGIDPAKSIVFEDSMSGVQAASGAGAIVIGINDPEFSAVLQKSGAELVMPDFRSVSLASESQQVTLTPLASHPETFFNIDKQ